MLTPALVKGLPDDELVRQMRMLLPRTYDRLKEDYDLVVVPTVMSEQMPSHFL